MKILITRCYRTLSSHTYITLVFFYPEARMLLIGVLWQSKSLFKYKYAVLFCIKWITREHAKVDRIACPWLIKNFVDKDSEFFFVPAHKVIQLAKEQNAIPFDVPNAELGHHGDECSFDAIIKKYHLDKKEPKLLELAKIVRGADTPNRALAPQSEGLVAIATGFSLTSKDDHDNMAKQCYVYDAILAYCKSDKDTSSRH